MDDQPSFVDKVLEGVVHVGLEGGQRVAESEEHDGWLEEPEGCGEGHLPMVLGSDEDVVVSLANVKLGEDLAVLKFIH